MALKEDTLISLFIIDGYRSVTNGNFGRINIVSPELSGGQAVTYVNEAGATVEYQPVPVSFGGVEVSGSNKLPTPKVRFANVDGGLTDLSRDFDDLIGFRLIRIRTYAKFLLKIGTSPGSSPDSNAHFTPDTWYSNRKVEETKLSVSYELASIFDVEGLMLPRRRLYSNFCPFAYRGPECKYAGPNVPTSGQFDGCLKTLTACQQHFGAQGLALRYGGFPTAQN